VRAAIAALWLLTLAGCLSGDKALLPDQEPGATCERPDEAMFGRNPATGMCVEFDTPCDVPSEWMPCKPLVACTGDPECAADQHCADQPDDGDPSTPARACVANGSCQGADDCGTGFACDPALGMCVQAGGPAPPDQPGCLSTSECAAGEICPAQYGGCSEGLDDPDAGMAPPCPSQCEVACVEDKPCGDGRRCNAAEVCGTANGGPDCVGWCVAVAGAP
jgi:hypothetical protein